MTITYLFAYFFTPSALRFDVPIIHITFAQLVEIVWPRKYFLFKQTFE